MDTTLLSDSLIVKIAGSSAIHIFDTLKTLNVNQPNPSVGFQHAVGIAKIIGALGTFLVAILAIWGDKIKPGPKLIISDHNLKGDLTVLQPGNTRAIYYHLKIENKRKYITAKNVRLVLIGIKRKVADGSYRENFMATCPQFVNTPAELSIFAPSVKDFQIVDFGRLVEGEDRFTPAIYVTPNNFQGFVGRNESVQYKFKILADNFYDSKGYEYEIPWDGQWSDNMDTMRNHLVMKKI